MSINLSWVEGHKYIFLLKTRNVCITKYARLYKLSNGKEFYL